MTEATEKDKMLRGELYKAFEPALTEDRQQIKKICFDLNQTPPSEQERRTELIFQLNFYVWHFTINSSYHEREEDFSQL